MDHLSDVVLNGIIRMIRPLSDRDPTVFFFGFQSQATARLLAETELEVVFEQTDCGFSNQRGINPRRGASRKPV